MGYWIVDDSDRYDDIDDLCSWLFDSDRYYDSCDEDDLDEWIDEIYSGCEICGNTFYASQIVRECDNYLYSELKSDYARSQAENDQDYYYHDLENMDNEDNMDVNGYSITYFADEEDEEDEEETEEAVEIQPDYHSDPFYADEEELDEEEEIIIKTLMDHFQKVS